MPATSTPRSTVPPGFEMVDEQWLHSLLAHRDHIRIGRVEIVGRDTKRSTPLRVDGCTPDFVAHLQGPIEYADVFEDLERSRANLAGLGDSRGRLNLVDDSDLNAVAAKFARQKKPCWTGAYDHDRTTTHMRSVQRTRGIGRWHQHSHGRVLPLNSADGCTRCGASPRKWSS